MSIPNKPTNKDQSTTPLRSLIKAIQVRIIQGLLLALPVVITFWIIYWLYSTLRNLVIGPVASLVVWVVGGGNEQPSWFENFVAPPAAIAIVLVVLYILGRFVHTRLHRTVDWVLLRVPLVTNIYAAVRNVFSALDTQKNEQRFQRVVLVPFPHAGMKAPAFVTSTCRDKETGRTIVCVYVPTTPVPTSGYMLMLPEEDVTELQWDFNETLQAIVSGGISVPPEVTYFPPPAPGGGEAAEGASQ